MAFFEKKFAQKKSINLNNQTELVKRLTNQKNMNAKCIMKVNLQVEIFPKLIICLYKNNPLSMTVPVHHINLGIPNLYRFFTSFLTKQDFFNMGKQQ